MEALMVFQTHPIIEDLEVVEDEEEYESQVRTWSKYEISSERLLSSVLAVLHSTNIYAQNVLIKEIRIEYFNYQL